MSNRETAESVYSEGIPQRGVHCRNSIFQSTTTDKKSRMAHKGLLMTLGNLTSTSKMKGLHK